MIGIAQLERWLSLRRLRQRAGHMIDLARNPRLTIYPQRMQFAFPKGTSVIVCTPHADDETFGAGGAIIRHIASGHRVSVVLFSDNARSIASADLSRQEKVEIRSKEFHRAMDILGVEERTELFLPASAFKQTTGCEALRDILIGNPAQVLYLPSLFDNHEEHRVVNLWVAEELSSLPHVSCIVRAYEVWSPVTANMITDITQVLTQKRNAIACYTSQLQMIDYEHHMLGLNAYRAMAEPEQVRYAEAFFEAPSDVYVTLAKQYLNT